MTLMKLKHVENKWNLERQLLEEEIEKLRREIAVVGNAQRRLFWQEEKSGKCKIYILYFYLNFSLFLESPEPENPVAAQLNIFFILTTTHFLRPMPHKTNSYHVISKLVFLF